MRATNMKVAMVPIVSGVLAFVFALPPAYMLADLNFANAAAWAVVPAFISMACVIAWSIRHPRERLTGIVAICIALIAFVATLIVFAGVVDQPWQWKIFFVVMSTVMTSGYAVLAAVASMKVVEMVQ